MCAQAADAPEPSGSETVAATLEAFLLVQQRRAQLFRRFDEAHRLYVRTRAEGPFKHVMVQLTAQFQECSQEVIRLAERLEGPLGSPQAAALLREVQQHEREKLELTLSQQALKAAYAHQQFSWQRGGDEEEAGAVGWAGHICGPGCSHPGMESEPTKAEYDAALKESYQRLQANTVAINDLIVEVQQLREELLGGEEVEQMEQ